MGKPVAVVVGVGAERGLGAALCRRFAAGGHHVLVAGRSPDKIEQVVRAVHANGGSAEPVPTDTTHEEDVVRLFDRATSPGAGLDPVDLVQAPVSQRWTSPTSDSISTGAKVERNLRKPMPMLQYAYLASLMLAAAGPARAQDAERWSNDAPQRNERPRDDLTRWLESHFSEVERKALRSEDLDFQSVYCGCYDKPVKHFPYAMAVVRTPKGDLLMRPERTEGGTIFTAVATRFGQRYCSVESESDCYGTFLDLCAFTDFRFGPALLAYFPTCKSEDTEESR